MSARKFLLVRIFQNKAWSYDKPNRREADAMEGLARGAPQTQSACGAEMKLAL